MLAYNRAKENKGTERKEKVMKQKKIAGWLKGITIMLGIMGILFFGGFTWMAFELKGIDEGNPLWMWIFFSWYIAVLCYVILFEFWNICTQIGKNNSFSKENVVHFHRMGLCGIGGAIGFTARLLWLVVLQRAEILNVGFSIAEILIALVFIVLCEALSGLVQYAYDMKQENDLTI